MQTAGSDKVNIDFLKGQYGTLASHMDMNIFPKRYCDLNQMNGIFFYLPRKYDLF